MTLFQHMQQMSAMLENEGQYQGAFSHLYTQEINFCYQHQVNTPQYDLFATHWQCKLNTLYPVLEHKLDICQSQGHFKSHHMHEARYKSDTCQLTYFICYQLVIMYLNFYWTCKNLPNNSIISSFHCQVCSLFITSYTTTLVMATHPRDGI